MQLVQKPTGQIVDGAIRYQADPHDTNAIDLTKAPMSLMQKIRGKDVAMIFQDPMTSLNPVFSVGHQITEMILLHTDKSRHEARAHAAHMLELVGISDPQRRMKQYPHEFSGGMRQRVMIAMALSCRPKLLIADEPTTALDVTIQAQILALMKKLSSETDAAVLLITHDLGIVADTCDRVAVMYAGMVAESGSADDLFYKTAHPYTRGLLGCLPRLDTQAGGHLDTIEGVPLDLLNLPEGCAFATRCKHAMKACLKAVPPAFEVSQGHMSRCWLHAVPGGEGGPS